MVMEVTPASSSMRTKISTRQMVRMLRAVMRMQQMAVRSRAQAMGLMEGSVGVRVLMDSTGVRQWQWRVTAVNCACWAVPQAKAHSLQSIIESARVQRRSALAVYVGASVLDASTGRGCMQQRTETRYRESISSMPTGMQERTGTRGIQDHTLVQYLAGAVIDCTWTKKCQDAGDGMAPRSV